MKRNDIRVGLFLHELVRSKLKGKEVLCEKLVERMLYASGDGDHVGFFHGPSLPDPHNTVVVARLLLCVLNRLSQPYCNRRDFK